MFGGHYLSRAFGHQWLWPLLGFFFLPMTTLGFAYAMNSLASGGQISPLGWLVVAVAAALDVGLIGGGGRSARTWRRARGRE